MTISNLPGDHQDTPDNDLISIVIPDARDCFRDGRPGPIEPHFLNGRALSAASPLDWGPPTFEFPENGNAMREAVTYRRTISTFSCLSLKSCRTQTGEGPHEYRALQHLEVLPDVVDYQMQAVTLRSETSAGSRAYTPDVWILLADGSEEAWEIKGHWRYFHDPEYAEKLAYAETAFAEIGVRFRRVVGAELDRSRTEAFNITRAFHNRFTKTGPHDVEAALDGLARRGGEAPMGQVQEALHPDRRIARAKANALLCRRQIVFSLAAPITADTPVTAPPPLPADLRDIRNLNL